MMIHDPEQLACHALGLLSVAEGRELDEHLGECEACSQEFAILREVFDSVPPETFIDDPPASDAPLRTVLERIREETGEPRRGLSWRVPRGVQLAAAAAAVAIALIGGGVVAGHMMATPASAPIVVAGGGQVVEGTNGPARLTARVTPSDAGQVQVTATTEGLPPGQRCHLVVVTDDGTEHVAASWITRPAGTNEPPADITGSAVVAADQVRSIAVRSEAGETFVMVPVRF